MTGALLGLGPASSELSVEARAFSLGEGCVSNEMLGNGARQESSGVRIKGRSTDIWGQKIGKCFDLVGT